jgi:hypothetical protein
MSKRLERMRSNPQGGWTISDVEALCREFDIACMPNRAGGSHYKVAHASQREILTIPFKRPIKPVYIRKLVDFVDAVRSVQ